MLLKVTLRALECYSLGRNAVEYRISAHLGKTDLVSVAQPLPKIWGAFLCKEDKNILSSVMKYWTREIGVYGPKMVLHIQCSQHTQLDKTAKSIVSKIFFLKSA